MTDLCVRFGAVEDASVNELRDARVVLKAREARNAGNGR
jgi:hypothetical protein